MHSLKREFIITPLPVSESILICICLVHFNAAHHPNLLFHMQLQILIREFWAFADFSTRVIFPCTVPL